MTETKDQTNERSRQAEEKRAARNRRERCAEVKRQIERLGIRRMLIR